MKKIIFVFLFLMTGNLWANLYITTAYQEAGNAPVVTKHHIFLNKKYNIEYRKMAYTLTLTRIGKDSGTIETETFVLVKGKKEFSAGGIASFTMTKPILLEQFSSQTGKREFTLKIIPEKIVPLAP